MPQITDAEIIKIAKNFEGRTYGDWNHFWGAVEGFFYKTAGRPVVETKEMTDLVFPSIDEFEKFVERK